MQFYPDPNNPNTQFLGTEEISKKKVKKILKTINSLPNFRVKGEIVLHLGKGMSIQGYARQKKILCIDDNFKQVRFILLDVYLNGLLYHFAIPIKLMSNYPPLLPLDLSKKELELLYKIVDALLDSEGRKEAIISMQRVEQVDVKLSRDQAMSLSFNDGLVANRIAQEPWILSTMTECLLTNLRPWIPEAYLPNHITAFVSSKQSGQVCQETLIQLLRACNQTANQMPLLNLHTAKELEEWQRYGCRMTLLNANSTIRKKLFERAQLFTLYRGFSMMEKPYPGQILLWSRTKCSDPNVFHIVPQKEADDKKTPPL